MNGNQVWFSRPGCTCEEFYMGKQIGRDGRWHDVKQTVYNPECPQHGQIGIS